MTDARTALPDDRPLTIDDLGLLPEGFGIQPYWIVKPDVNNPSLTAFEPNRGTYRAVAEVTGDETFRTTQPFAREIVPAELVAGPW